MKKIIIVGAGLTGAMLAIKLVRHGHDVKLFEKRPDMRKVDISAGRSINLALSNRGIQALESVGAIDKVTKTVIPMHGRMIHNIGKPDRFSPYSGRKGEHLNSASRGDLTKILMTQAEEEGAEIFFNCRCTYVDFKNGYASVTHKIGDKKRNYEADLIFGADGAGSVVRHSMMETSHKYRFSYSQKYLEHGYKELRIPPGHENTFRIEKNALHIWPKGTYMLIALPNYDGSFTVTLFLPFGGENGFDALDSPDKVVAFFKRQFPDTLPLIPDLAHDFFKNPTGALATVKCFPWQVNGKSLLMGDAAHAIVPFYGQGLNCSFEDCLVLEKIIDRNPDDWQKIFSTYQLQRRKDTDAIADLAEENFFEMRDHVSKPEFIKKRKLEMRLEHEFTSYYSKYSMVTFREDLPYSLAMKKGREQDRLLMEYCQNIELSYIDTVDLEEVLKQCSQLP